MRHRPRFLSIPAILMIAATASHAPAQPPPLTNAALGFEDLGSWVGPTPTRDDVKEGSQAALWADTVETTRVRLRNARLDASAYDRVTFWAYSETATGATLAFVLISENDATEGEDNLRYNFNVNWTGWKQFEVKKSDFKPVREPIGFSKIDHIVFASSGYNCGDPIAGTVIKLDDIRFVSGQAAPVGDSSSQPAPATSGTAGQSSTAPSAQAQQESAAAATGITWTPFDGTALSRTVAAEGSALVYFRSEIAMCKEFERAYLLTPEANRLLAGRTLYFADPTRSELIARQFRVFKVPTLVLVHKSGEPEMLSIDTETKPQTIAALLAKAAK